jgi:hypothetical protein
MSGFLEEKLKGCLTNFARDLDLTYQQLFEETFWQEKELQRRGVELDRENQWATIFFKLSDFDKIRMIENQSILRRKWIDACPIHKGCTLSDQQVRYGLQETFLSKFTEAVAPMRKCLGCGRPDGPLHHLSCAMTQFLRTTRHTAIDLCFDRHLRECGATGVERRPNVGMAANGESRFGDRGATIAGVRSNLDFIIVAADYNRPVRIPSDQEIQQEVEKDKQHGTGHLFRFLFWEDHSDETPHPTTLRLRKMRQIIFQETIAKDLRQADRSKFLHYGDLGICPISFTARGGMGRYTIPTVDGMCNCNSDWDYSDRIGFRSRFITQLSIKLLNSAHLMKVYREAHASDGC